MIYLDERYKGKEGKCPLKFRVTVNGVSVLVSTKIKVDPANYKGMPAETVTENEPNHDWINVYVANRERALEALVCQIRSIGIKPSKDELKNKVLQILGSSSTSLLPSKKIKKKKVSSPSSVQNLPIVSDEKLFTEYIEDYIEHGGISEGTKNIYRDTLKKVIRFSPALTPSQVDRKWLVSFNEHLTRKGLSPNSRGRVFKNISTIVNTLIDDDILYKNPFRKFKIPREDTRKRSLSVEDFRTLVFTDWGKTKNKYRDMFFLSFLLIGINPVDLLELTEENVKENRIDYYRRKTGKLYSIKLEPEAQKILEKYKGQKNLIEIAKNANSLVVSLGKCLKSLGTEKKKGKALFPDISMYWARHSWATFASKLNIPIDTISLALGHSAGNKTTAIYINNDLKKVDKANRLVIDYVFQKGKFKKKR